MKKLLVIVLLGALAACQTKPKEEPITFADNKEKAEYLAKKFIITDGHIDLPYRLKGQGFMAADSLPDIIGGLDGNIDYPKAKAGGLDAPFMSIYIPARLQKESGASKSLADSLITMVKQITTTYPEQFALAGSPAEVEENFKKGLISLPMGMENGSGLEDDLANVKYFFDRGIRYVTLTHSKDNLICDSSYDTTSTWNGLSEYGRQVVQEMNKQGIMVDISHVDDSTFYQVMELSAVPCIASHSSARKFTPEFERNMSDDMIKLLAEKGGVIQINFGSTFLLKRSQDKRKELSAAREQWKTENPEATEEEVREFNKTWLKENGFFADVEDVADHIDHVVKLVGIDHVGFGSDFDGVGDSLPTKLKTAADYPKLIEALLKRGYSEEDIAKVCYKNVFRVWGEVLAFAGK